MVKVLAAAFGCSDLGRHRTPGFLGSAPLDVRGARTEGTPGDLGVDVLVLLNPGQEERSPGAP